MPHRLALLLTALALVGAACGGGSDTTATDDNAAPATDATTAPADVSTTSTAATTTTVEEQRNTPSGSGADSEYCTRAQEDQTFEGFNVFSDDLEGEIERLLAMMAEAEAAAPDEIADDVRTLFNAFRELAALLAEYEYDLMAIPPDDPRLTGMDTPELEQAANNVAAYCGIDIDASGGDDGAPTGGAGAFLVGDDELPEDFPEALIPPMLEGVSDNGAAGLLLGSSAPLEEVIAFYTDLLGDPSFEDSESATYSGQVDGQMLFVNVVLADDIVLVTILFF